MGGFDNKFLCTERCSDEEATDKEVAHRGEAGGAEEDLAHGGEAEGPGKEVAHRDDVEGAGVDVLCCRDAHDAAKEVAHRGDAEVREEEPPWWVAWEARACCRHSVLVAIGPGKGTSTVSFIILERTNVHPFILENTGVLSIIGVDYGGFAVMAVRRIAALWQCISCINTLHFKF